MAKQCGTCEQRDKHPRCIQYISRGNMECRFKAINNQYAAGLARVSELFAEILSEEKTSGIAPGHRISYEDKRLWNGAPLDGSSTDNI